MRTTLDIDAPVLLELKRLQKREKKSLGRLASELLAFALKARRRKAERAGEDEPAWIAKPLGPPKVDLRDKDAIGAILDADEGWRHR
jgi:hypothetical protein